MQLLRSGQDRVVAALPTLRALRMKSVSGLPGTVLAAGLKADSIGLIGVMPPVSSNLPAMYMTVFLIFFPGGLYNQ